MASRASATSFCVEARNLASTQYVCDTGVYFGFPSLEFRLKSVPSGPKKPRNMLSQYLLLSFFALSTSMLALATPLYNQSIRLPSSFSLANFTSLTANTNTTATAPRAWPVPIREPISEGATHEYFEITTRPQVIATDSSYTHQVLRDIITILDINLNPDRGRGNLQSFHGSNGVVVLGFRMLSTYHLNTLAAYEMFARLARLEYTYGAASLSAEIYDGATKAGNVHVYLSLRAASVW